MKSLVQRLREADRNIESLALMDVYGRVAKLLLDFSEEERGQRVIRRRLTKQDIAKMIGASREMVSRVMKDLENQRLLPRRRRPHVILERARTGFRRALVANKKDPRRSCKPLQPLTHSSAPMAFTEQTAGRLSYTSRTPSPLPEKIARAPGRSRAG
jgi:hypothetical protein